MKRRHIFRDGEGVFRDRCVICGTPSDGMECPGRPMQAMSVAILALSMLALASLLLTGRAYAAGCTAFAYSEWSACQADGKQYHATTGYLPQGCDARKILPVITQLCAYTPPPTTPPCVPTLSAWSSPDARGVQTASLVSVSPVPCQVAAPIATAKCAPRAAVVTTLPDPRFPGNGATLPACSYSYLTWGLCDRGARTRPFVSNSVAMCGVGQPDSCAECDPSADRVADCIAHPIEESYDCDYTGKNCTVKRVARDCSRVK